MPLKSPASDSIQPEPDASVVQLTQLANAMDSVFAIPGTPIRFGFDSLIGLVPGAGDVAAALLSVYILHEARRIGVPKLTMARMATNVAIDAIGGAVPIAGDAFDVYWKSNQRNVTLLRKHLEQGGPNSPSRWGDMLFFGLLILFVISAITGGAVLTYLLVTWVVRGSVA